MTKITKNCLIIASLIITILFSLTVCKEPDNKKSKPSVKWTYTITFNKNFDGNLESEGNDWTEANPKSIKVISPADTVGELPKQPMRPTSGYQFVQWTVDKEGEGASFLASTKITESIEVYAQWIGPGEIMPIIGTASIDGMYRIGEELAVTIDEINYEPEEGNFIYQWKADDVDIDGANEDVYTIQPEDAGMVISCVITHSYAGGKITANGEEVLFNISGTASIEGTFIIGNELSVKIDEIINEPEEGELIYQWKAGDVDIDGANNETYTIRSADAGLIISCIITHSGTGGEIIATGEEVHSIIIGSAIINGIFRIDNELTVIINNINYTPEEGDFIYQWKSDGVDIDGANDETYIVQPADAGKVISCLIIHSGAPGSITAAGHEVPFNISGTATISGRNRIGDLLTVHLEDYSIPNMEGLIYQWKADDIDIFNAKNPTYTIQSADAGKLISCVITHSDTGGEIIAAGPVALYNIGGTAAIGGTYKIGEVLTVSTIFIDHKPDTGNFIFRWKAGNDNIDNAVTDTYTITGNDAGKLISCVITHTDTNGSVTASGEVVPYNITLTVKDVQGGDSASLSASANVDTVTGLAGSTVTIYYMLANILSNNWLDIQLPGEFPTRISNAGNGTKQYIVDASDAINGVISLDAVFHHSNKSPDTIAFASADTVNKIYGDPAFIIAVTNTGSGTGAITYTSSDTSVAEVASSTGSVTIKKITTSPVRITATKAEDANYASAVAHYDMEIDPKNVTITGLGAADKVYNGNTDAVITGSAVVNGKVGSDPVSVNMGKAGFNNKNAGSKTVTFTGFSLANNPDGNYHLERQPDSVTANITPFQLTVNGIEPDSKVYDGNTTAIIKTGWTDNSLESDNLLIHETALFSNKNAGSGIPVTVTFTISGSDAGNYLKPADITTGLSANITKLQLTVSNVTIASKVYDGNTSAVVTSSTSNQITGDALTINPAAVFADKNAGNGKQVNVTFSISGNDAGNYTAPNNTSSTGNITQLQLVMGNPTLTTSKTYDATTSAAVTIGSPTNRQGSDTINVTAAANYNNKSAGTGNKTITVVYTMGSGGDTANYSQPANFVITNGTISQYPLTVTGLTVATTKVYNGGTDAAITSQGTNNRITTDNLTITPTATYINKTVGNGKQVTVSFALSGNDAANYSTPANITNLNASITALQLTISGTSASAMTYNGSTNASSVVTAGTLQNKIASDTVTPTISSATYNDSNAGSKTITVVYGLTGADSGNYTAPVNGTITGTISKAAGSAINTVPTVKGNPTAFTIAFNAASLSTATGQGIEYAISTSGTNAPANNQFAPGADMNPQFTFSSLTASTTYYVWARSADSTNYSTGTARASAAIATVAVTGDALLNGLWWSQAHITGQSKWSVGSPFNVTVNTPGVLYIDGNKFWDLSDWGWAHKGSISVSGNSFTLTPATKKPKDGNNDWTWGTASTSDARTVTWALSNNNNTLSVTFSYYTYTYNYTFQRTTWDSTEAVNGTGPASWNSANPRVSWQTRIGDSELNGIISNLLKFGWNDAGTEFRFPPLMSQPYAAEDMAIEYNNVSATRVLTQPFVTGRPAPAQWALGGSSVAESRLVIRTSGMSEAGQNRLQTGVFRQAQYLVFEIGPNFKGYGGTANGTSLQMIYQWYGSTPIRASPTSTPWQYDVPVTGTGQLVHGTKETYNVKGGIVSTTRRWLVIEFNAQSIVDYHVFAGANQGTPIGTGGTTIFTGEMNLIYGFASAANTKLKDQYDILGVYLINIVN